MAALEQPAPEVARDPIVDLFGPLRLPSAYCPYYPHVKQEWFLRRPEFEAFFGGSAGPGKSWGLLMAALQYVDVPGYDALLLRPTLGEFTQPGGLIEVAHDWLSGTDAWWHGGERKWTFPSGATLRFGYLRTVADLKQYKGPSFSFVGFDELTSFPENLYRGTFRLLRQALGGPLDDVPLRMRSASNPGDIGHQWVKSRFIQPETRDPAAAYVRATIHDNPFLDYATYLQSLSHMDPVDQLRLINGDWDVMEEGGKFARANLTVIAASKVKPPVQAIRYWDLAATEEGPANKDPDYTVGLLYEVDADGYYTIRDISRGRWADADVENNVRAAAEADALRYGDPGFVTYYIEQEPGASGKIVLSNFTRKVLDGFTVYKGLPRGGNKEVRSRPVAAAVANRLVRFVESCANLREAQDELVIFPNGTHDDVVDALSGAHGKITARDGREGTSTVPAGRIPGVEARAPSPGAVPIQAPQPPPPVPAAAPADPAPEDAPAPAQPAPTAVVARVPPRRPPGRIA